MTTEQAKNFTIRRIIFYDMLLNWFLGIVLVMLPGLSERALTPVDLLPHWIYQLNGVAFLGFAAWQTWIVRRDDIGAAGLIFAALLAEIPVIALTIALVFWNPPLHPISRILLWIGNIYMLFLGVWYFTLAWRVSKTGIKTA